MAITGSGRCLCGAVQFETTTPLDDVIGCHCKQCQKQTSHFVAATRTVREGVSIQGEENVQIYRASSTAARYFCKICGSVMFWRADDSPNISIMAGSFDQPSTLKMTRHIYCAEKGDYYELNDGLPQYPELD